MAHNRTPDAFGSIYEGGNNCLSGYFVYLVCLSEIMRSLLRE